MKLKRKPKKEIIKLRNIAMAYCINCIETMDLTDEEEYKMADKTTNYLMNEKIYNFTEKEAKYLMYFFAKLGMQKLDKDLEKKVQIEIANDEKMQEFESKDSMAICLNNRDGTSKIVYSDEVVKNIMSDDIEEISYGIQIVFHEVVHSLYNKLMCTNYLDINPLYAIRTYAIALENLIGDIAEEYYNDNYDNLIQENEAERMAIISTVNMFKKYNKKVSETLNVDVLKKRIKSYQEKPLKSNRKLFGVNTKEGQNLEHMEFAAKKILEIEPWHLDRYPILKIAYNEDGTRKNILQLLVDREKRMQRKNVSEKSINDLFYAILDNRITTIDEEYKEIEELNEYSQNIGKKDVFLEDLMKTRLIRMAKKGKKTEQNNKNNSSNDDNDENNKNFDEK